MITTHMLCTVNNFFMMKMKISCLREKKNPSVIVKFRILKALKRQCNSGIISFGKFVTEVLIFRSSHSQMFFKIRVIKNFAIFT